jgi:hypothetical protein
MGHLKSESVKVVCEGTRPRKRGTMSFDREPHAIKPRQYYVQIRAKLRPALTGARRMSFMAGTDKQRLRGHPNDQQESDRHESQRYERAEMMIVGCRRKARLSPIQGRLRRFAGVSQPRHVPEENGLIPRIPSTVGRDWRIGQCVYLRSFRMIQKIISGGQTGADRMALDWAIWHATWRLVPHRVSARLAPRLDTRHFALASDTASRECCLQVSYVEAYSEIVKRLFIIIFLCTWVIIPWSRAGTCSPTGMCTACTTCNYCKNCSQRGGACSICR